MINWHIITGEYPPQSGGVSDYTRLVAEGLAAAGDGVTVWAPPLRIADRGSRIEEEIRNPQSAIREVSVERLPDHFGIRSLRTLTRELDRYPTPRRLLVQYVPHAFGWKAANVPFCAWLRSRRRDSVWVMFHEVWYPFSRDAGVAHNALAAVNHLMASLVGGGAERAFVSIPAWRPIVRRLMGSRPVDWLPVPSAVPVAANACESARVRARYGNSAPIVGHFGTYGRSIVAMLEPAVRSIVESSDAQILLLGRRSDLVAAEFANRHPPLAGRVAGAGPLSPEELSHHLTACDVMVQPYPDGVSTRRTSVMAGLAHERPIVTTRGWLTEDLWEESQALLLTPADDVTALGREVVALLGDPPRRSRLSASAGALYATRFDLSHTIAALRAADAARS